MADAEYRLSSDSQPFVIFLADIAPQTPIKALRLKLILFLQGSPFYDLNAAATQLESITPLKTELAVVLGRQGKNKRALRLLGQDIGDFVSAQAYCTQGGEIVPPRVAHLVASHVPELVGWATLGDVGRKRRGTVDAKVQHGLVMDLLGVYMQDRSVWCFPSTRAGADMKRLHHEARCCTSQRSSCALGYFGGELLCFVSGVS